MSAPAAITAAIACSLKNSHVYLTIALLTRHATSVPVTTSAGEHIGEAKEYAFANFPNLKYVNGYDDVEICAGAGSMGIEILGNYTLYTQLLLLGLCVVLFIDD